MDAQKIERINYLARASRERELTEAEKTEQAQLRKEYIEAYRNSLENQLKNIVVEEKDGTRHKLNRRD